MVWQALVAGSGEGCVVELAAQFGELPESFIAELVGANACGDSGVDAQTFGQGLDFRCR
jgi:hypothetical protein